MTRHRLTWIALAAAFLFVVSGTFSAQSRQASFGGRERRTTHAAKQVEGEVLVKFRRGTSETERMVAHGWVGARRLRTFRSVSGLEHVRLPEGSSVKEAIALYRTHPDVEYAEPNFVVEAVQDVQATPNDPQFGTQWGLHNTGQSGGTVDADIDAPEAWNITTGSSSVVVAVIDTGIDYTHQDLAANMFQNTADCNANGVDDDGNGYIDDCYGIDTANHDSNPMDDNGHGTHTAGTIGAVGNNSIGVVGVNWNVGLMSCKFLDANGSGTTANAIACLDYVKTMKDRGVNIVATSNSWGGGGYSQALYDAIDRQRQAGILFIAAAGNSTTDNDLTTFYPASYALPNIISVAATTRTDGLASFSSYGRRTVHLGAPGQSILSTTPNNTYSIFSGTSMATPHVSGVAALLKAQDPSRDWRAIKNLILAGGDTIPSLANTMTGKRLNANGALTCVSSTVTSRRLPVNTFVPATLNTPIPLAALNINCANPNGPVTVTVNPGGSTITLVDDGTSGDQVAGDGMYSGQFTPTVTQTYTLTFPGGDVVTVGFPAPYYVSPAAYNYRTIAGTNLNLLDETSASITPPFPVSFGGFPVQTLLVSDNGVMGVNGPVPDFFNVPLPDSAVPMLVAPFWDDLDPSGLNNVYWDVIGAAPHRELVVEWRDVPTWNCPSGGTLRFETVFFEGSSNVLFNYADTVVGGACASADHGALATVGVQVAAAQATQFSYNTGVLSDQTALLWTLAPATVTANATTVAAGGALTFTVANGPGNMLDWVGFFCPSTLSDAGYIDWKYLSDTRTAPAIGLTGATVTFTAPTTGSATCNARLFANNTMTKLAASAAVAVMNPVPTITTLTPPSIVAGSAAFTLAVTGTNFLGTSVVQVNGAPRATTFVDAAHLTASILAADVMTQGANPAITVVNPAPGGGTSNGPVLTVTPAPTVTVSATTVAPSGVLAFTVANGPGNLLDWVGLYCPSTLLDTGFTDWKYLSDTRMAPAIGLTGATVTFAAPPTVGATCNARLFINNTMTKLAMSATATVTVPNPIPTLAMLTPSSIVAGSAAFTLTVTGTGFVATSRVQVNGADRATIFVDAAHVTASILSGDVVTPGANPAVTAVNPTPGGGSSNSLTLTVTPPPPAPTITTIAPMAVALGGPAFTLAVSGTNFVGTSVVRVDGAARPTTFGSATQLTAQLTAADRASAGTHNITVVTPAPGGGTSSAATLTITAPTVTVGSPGVVPGGTMTFTVSNGPGNLLDWVGFYCPSALADTGFMDWKYLSNTRVAPGSALTAATVTFAAPTTVGATCNARFFTNNTMTRLVTSLDAMVVNVVPTVATLSPASLVAGSAAFTLTVTGTGFISGSIVRVDGADRTTMVASPTQVTAAIPATDVASVGTHTVTVFNPTPGGGASNGATLTVTPPPTVTVNSVAVAPGGLLAFTVANGPGNMLDWVGLFCPSTLADTGAFIDWKYLSDTRAAPAIGLTGATVTFTAPTTGGTKCNARLFVNNTLTRLATSADATVSSPVPTITTLTPSSIAAGSSAFTLTVTGTGFVPTSRVQVNGGDRTTIFVDAAHVTAPILAADVMTQGANPAITVVSSAPGGGTSNSLTLTVTPAPTLTANSTTVAPGGVLAFTVANGPGNMLDWVGLFCPSTLADTGGFIDWKYLSDTRAAPAIGLTGATVTFTAPTTAGTTCNARLFINNTMTRLATSADATVSNPVPTITTLTPSGIVAGSSAFTLTVTGTGFVPTSRVQVNGGDRTTTFVDAAHVTAPILAADVMTQRANPAITVVSSAPGGGTSNSLTLTVTPAPTVTANSTTVAPGGVLAFTVANGPGNMLDWVGLFCPSTLADTGGFIDWKYLSDTRAAPAIGLTGATVTFTAPTTAGTTCNARLFVNNTMTRLATSATATVP